MIGYLFEKKSLANPYNVGDRSFCIPTAIFSTSTGDISPRQTTICSWVARARIFWVIFLVIGLWSKSGSMSSFLWRICVILSYLDVFITCSLVDLWCKEPYYVACTRPNIYGRTRYFFHLLLTIRICNLVSIIFSLGCVFLLVVLESLFLFLSISYDFPSTIICSRYLSISLDSCSFVSWILQNSCLLHFFKLFLTYSKHS